MLIFTLQVLIRPLYPKNTLGTRSVRHFGLSDPLVHYRSITGSGEIRPAPWSQARVRVYRSRALDFPT